MSRMNANISTEHSNTSTHQQHAITQKTWPSSVEVSVTTFKEYKEFKGQERVGLRSTSFVGFILTTNRTLATWNYSKKLSPKLNTISIVQRRVMTDSRDRGSLVG